MYRLLYVLLNTMSFSIIMAEDEDGVSNKKSPHNSNNEEDSSQESGQNVTRPDLGIEEAKYNSNENDDTAPSQPRSSCSKSTATSRKDENPFSFRHFLKRDLSLPGNSTYESTGARPKVYANTVQHSPTKLDVHAEPRRERARVEPAKDSDRNCHRTSDNTSSSSSVEIPFSVVDNSESKHNFYDDGAEVPFYHRPNLASEPLGMPSLPDFVQDHILVEQAYLNSNGPLSVDLDNLPDFTFNTNYNAGSSSRGNRVYNYDTYMGTASTSGEGVSARSMPLDLPSGAEAAGPLPLDLPPHLSLDLTESVNPADRRNNSPRNTFPLDLPLNSESMRLPDFLPVHPGRTSPEPEHPDVQLQNIILELQHTRSELLAERSRRSRAEGEAAGARAAAERLMAAHGPAQGPAHGPTQGPAHGPTQGPAHGPTQGPAHGPTQGPAHGSTQGTAHGPAHGPTLHSARQTHSARRTHSADTDHADASRAATTDSTVTKLKNQIKRLKEELAASQEEVRVLRARQAGAASDLRTASRVAETSLRELLAGLEQLRSLGSSLDTT